MILVGSTINVVSAICKCFFNTSIGKEFNLIKMENYQYINIISMFIDNDQNFQLII